MFWKKKAAEKFNCIYENDGWTDELKSRLFCGKYSTFDLQITSCARGISQTTSSEKIENFLFFAKYWTSRYKFIPCTISLDKDEKKAHHEFGNLKITSEREGGHSSIPKLSFNIFVDEEENNSIKECIIEMSLMQGRPANIVIDINVSNDFSIKSHLGMSFNTLPICGYTIASYLNVETLCTPYDNQVDNFLSDFRISRHKSVRPQI